VGELNIAPNVFATVEYELRDEAGTLLDSSREPGGEPMRYVHGYGMLVPGLEAALAGLSPGDERDVLLAPEAAYGDYDESLVLELSMSDLPPRMKVHVGDELVAESPDGDEMAVTVVAIEGDSVRVDANHPLAGKTLRYKVRVDEVRPATASEIEDAAAELDEAHEHVHGPDCDHDHQGELVSVGKPPLN
jgi:FKBP-type peptidyl-prolyl cis-trans isomerase SlyD